MSNEITGLFPISKRMVYNSYVKVIEDKSLGIDNQSIEEFHEDLSCNLNKIWNGMASGRYFPPRGYKGFIFRKPQRKKPIGIPTISDLIAQGVVRDYMEPILENIFHPGSFGYRPGRCIGSAIKQYQQNCIKYAWVIHVEVKGLSDNIGHNTILELLQRHTRERWILLYAERWLKAGVQPEDGSKAARRKGIPPVGVIGSLFADIYLHHIFDKWMDEVNGQNPFERHADDIVIHCGTRKEAEELLEKMRARMQQHELELHPKKTKIVYCKNYQRNDIHYNNSFSFLDYIFQAGAVKDKFNRKNPWWYFVMILAKRIKHAPGRNLEQC